MTRFNIKVETFAGTGKSIHPSLHFLFCLGDHVRVISIQKVSNKSLKCLRFSSKSSIVCQLYDVECIYVGHGP